MCRIVPKSWWSPALANDQEADARIQLPFPSHWIPGPCSRISLFELHTFIHLFAAPMQYSYFQTNPKGFIHARPNRPEPAKMSRQTSEAPSRVSEAKWVWAATRDHNASLKRGNMPSSNWLSERWFEAALLDMLSKPLNSHRACFPCGASAWRLIWWTEPSHNKVFPSEGIYRKIPRIRPPFDAQKLMPKMGGGLICEGLKFYMKVKE